MIEYSGQGAEQGPEKQSLGPKGAFVNPVAEYAARIMENPRTLSLDNGRIEAVAQILAEQTIDIPDWSFPPYPTQGSNEELARYMLVLNAINYCYFHPDFDAQGQEVRFSEGKDNGSTLAAKRLTESFSKIVDPDYLIQLDEEQVEDVLFKAAVPIPLAAERAAHLREVGVFLKKLEDRGEGLLDFCGYYNKSAFHIAAALQDHMPGFQDPFMKRSQLFVALMYGRLQNEPECPVNTDTLRGLTQFADYRLPQTKIAQGIIVPEKSLADVIEKRQLIPDNSTYVREIRAASVHSGELLRNRINELRSDGTEVNAVGLDYLDWKAPRDQSKGAAAPGLFIQEFGNYPRIITTDF